MAASFRSQDGALMRPSPRWLGAAFGTFGLAAAVVAAALASGLYPLLVFLIHLVLLGSLALSYALRSTRSGRFSSGTLTVEDGAVTFDGRVLARADEIEQAFVVPGETTLVRIERTGTRLPLHVRVASVDEGNALVQALSLDASKTAAEMRIASGLLAMSTKKQALLMLGPIFGAFLPLLGLSALVLGGRAMPYAIPALVSLLLTYSLGLALSPTRVRIGADGIVTRWLGRSRYIPLSQIDDSQTYSEFLGGKENKGVKLRLADGETLRLPTGQTSIGEVDAARLAQRIEEARNARPPLGAQHPAAALARRGRSFEAWLQSLKSLGTGANAGMRTATVPLDALLALVEDASALPIERVSAAVASLGQQDESAKRRIRVAADTTASPRLRIALEQVARDGATDEEIRETLAELEADGAPTALRPGL